MACMCGDLYCGSCGPAQGNHRCDECGEWEADHEENHIGPPFVRGDRVLMRARSLKGRVGVVLKEIKSRRGMSYIVDFEVGGAIGTYRRVVAAQYVNKGHLVLVTGRDGCKHDDTKCQGAAQAAAEAEAEALAERETERLLKEYEEAQGHSILQADERRDLREEV